MNNIPKDAICIRNASSWGHVKPEHKFDSPKFKPASVLSDLAKMSPKMNAVINKIRELDDNDVKVHGKYYKHIIYSDVSGVFGAKMVASVLIANGFKLVYNNGQKIKGKQELEDNKTFALLTTSTVYQKPLSVKLKKTMLASMNERPDNIYGRNIRILVIDPGFKEGIDVFDVKYMHMLEPLVTKAEQTQVIGRGTRYCGQMGLPFIPEKGWPLHVFRYNMMYDENTNAHEFFLKYSNQNISALNFIADIEDLLITSAVDLPLTENLHNFEHKNNRFYNMMKTLKKSLEKPAVKSPPKQRKDFIRIVNNIRGQIYTNDEKIDCRQKCKGHLEMAPKAILMIAAIYVDKKELIAPLNKQHPKPLLCNYIDKIPEFCSAINFLWRNPIRFLSVYKKRLSESMEWYKSTYELSIDNYKEMKAFIRKYIDEEPKAKPVVIKPPAVPPPNRLTYFELQKYIEKHYGEDYTLDKVEVRNKCINNEPKGSSSSNKKAKKDYDIVSFTKTQAFVKDYFMPMSPYKGLFAYHSVGSGKTCTAIATATNSFDKQGYTILWVTRHTLKEDIWKNMFDKICNVVIQERIKRGERFPATRAERMRILGDNWMQPISYKQFTNMITGKNKFYKEMVARNGKEDPFKKTLVIIDEIHKIFSHTLSALEKPNPTVLQNMIQNSFDKSGHNSIRLLVMTATPITEDPMSVIKIINLLMPRAEQFSEDFYKFKYDYCQENGLFTDVGAMRFMNKVAGLVSYIDKSTDVSQFAHPIIKDILVETGATEGKVNGKIGDLQNRIDEIEVKVKEGKKELSKEDMKTLKDELKELKKTMKQIEKEKNSPDNVIAYINECITKNKKKLKEAANNGSSSNSQGKKKGRAKTNKVDDGSGEKKEKKERKPKEPKVPKEKKEPKVPKEKKECPEGQIRNEKTGRCIKDPSLKKEKKPRGKKSEGGGRLDYIKNMFCTNGSCVYDPQAIDKSQVVGEQLSEQPKPLPSQTTEILEANFIDSQTFNDNDEVYLMIKDGNSSQQPCYFNYTLEYSSGKKGKIKTTDNIDNKTNIIWVLEKKGNEYRIKTKGTYYSLYNKTDDHAYLDGEDPNNNYAYGQLWHKSPNSIKQLFRINNSNQLYDSSGRLIIMIPLTDSNGKNQNYPVNVVKANASNPQVPAPDQQAEPVQEKRIVRIFYIYNNKVFYICFSYQDQVLDNRLFSFEHYDYVKISGQYSNLWDIMYINTQYFYLTTSVVLKHNGIDTHGAMHIYPHINQLSLQSQINPSPNQSGFYLFDNKLLCFEYNNQKYQIFFNCNKNILVKVLIADNSMTDGIIYQEEDTLCPIIIN